MGAPASCGCIGAQAANPFPFLTKVDEMKEEAESVRHFGGPLGGEFADGRLLEFQKLADRASAGFAWRACAGVRSPAKVFAPHCSCTIAPRRVVRNRTSCRSGSFMKDRCQAPGVEFQALWSTAACSASMRVMPELHARNLAPSVACFRGYRFSKWHSRLSAPSQLEILLRAQDDSDSLDDTSFDCRLFDCRLLQATSPSACSSAFRSASRLGSTRSRWRLS